MADNVQWIRLKVGMFDGNSFKKIKRAKIGGVSYRDKLTAIWFELLDLAGKCNSNGYLIDNNEIAYQSYEDIATMLDRDEKEIELCMQFFIKERMVEIIEDVYCLTNFMQYQNQDGLEKIREQNRERQARFRENRKQKLLETKSNNVTHNVTSRKTSYSISNSNSISYIFNYWNTKNIIVHKELSIEMSKAIEKALKIYSEEEIMTYIDRYAQVFHHKGYFFHYKWSLADFLNRKEGISAFTDEGSKWNSYQDFLQNPKPTEKQEEENPYANLKIGEWY